MKHALMAAPFFFLCTAPCWLILYFICIGKM